jgi:membrane-bound lytic murein transglycosylase F
MRHIRKLFSLSVTLLLACTAKQEVPTVPTVPPLQDKGELTVLLRNGATTFYVDSEGKYAGLDYDLVTLFAAQNGMKVKIEVAPRIAETPDRLSKHQAHLGVGLIRGDHHSIHYGPEYLQVQPVLVYRSDAREPKDLNDLGDSILMAGSQYVPTLQSLHVRYPKLHWHEAQFQDTEDLVEKVANGLIDYAVADDYGVGVAQNYHPNADVAFDVGTPLSLGWAWSDNVPKDFASRVDTFFAGIKKDGTLAHLIDRYYGHATRLQTDDATAFLSKRLTDLPKYRHLFMDAAAAYGLDWRLLAALSYQESHWDRFATSAYGVRGLMMLTNDTADKLGVDDRLDPAESITGGAKYLDILKSELPPRIQEPDRSWLTLASYNIGTAHLEDARVLAQRLGKNPNNWTDLKTVIPLLRNFEYFSTLKYGFARGGETVVFVENVRSYYDILVRFEKPDRPMFPPFNEQVTVANPEGVKLGIDSSAGGN